MKTIRANEIAWGESIELEGKTGKGSVEGIICTATKSRGIK